MQHRLSTIGRTTRPRFGTRARRVAGIGSAAAAVAALLVAAPAGSAAGASTAPGGPGVMSHFDLARKDCLGTARNTTSKVWFTVAGGVLSDTYYPTIDNTNVETLQLVVTDGSTFTDLQTRDMTYTVQSLDPSGMACRVISTAKSGRYSLTTDYVTDPARNSVLMRTTLDSQKGDGLRVYARLDATVNGNGGGGDPSAENAGADNATIDTTTGAPVPVSSDTSTATTAANRDYAQPVFVALRGDRPFLGASSGFAGTASDGLTQLDAAHQLTTTYDTATDGNVVQTAQVDTSHGKSFMLALGFGGTQAAAVATAGASTHRAFQAARDDYVAGWAAYDAGLNAPALSGSAAQQARTRATYYLSANVLKASEDKTFAGAIVASMASPWGQAVPAGDPSLTYFGSYREVFSRDLYETFTGLVASGDLATARDTVRFLFDRQQQADGSMPRNSLVNGKTAPDTFGTQLDEVAYPILMARTVGLTDATFYTDHIKKAADFVVAHGPSFGSERWEEQSGYSPSTIAAEIAGLTAAGAIGELNGDAAGARVYRATADHYQRSIKSWTLTTQGTLSSQPYFLRLSKTGDPDAAISYNLGNGSGTYDQRSVIDAGFLELARLGELPQTDPDIQRTLGLVDSTIGRSTSSGTGYYRYGTPDAGSEDGYGDCNVSDGTDCTVQGKPWAGACQADAQNHGSGHLWPALAAERAEHDLVTGDAATARSLQDGMAKMASGVGLIPEQAWEDPDQPASPYGTDPQCASIGFANGKAAGSASPLTWSAASYVRLTHDIGAGAVTETPVDTTARYLLHQQQGTTITLTSPADNSLVGATAHVAGTTTPGSTVDIDAVNVDIDGSAKLTTTVADSTGAFAVDAPVPLGTDTLTVTATTPDGATGFAQRTVVRDVLPGTLIYSASDPDGDDNGPGTYEYPRASDFQPGAYDLQAFEVYDSGPSTVTFRVRTRDLTPTFGSPLGAQLVDVYVRNPGSSGPRSTAASFPQRNYAIAAGSAWDRLIEVQGFGQRFIDASGSTVGSVQIRANAITRYITFTVDKSALGGTPASGWTFSVVLTGQDGFSPDQARGFTQPAQDYQFGVCTQAAVTAGSPICSVSPSTVPKAVDVITPTGVLQSDELDPTKHSPVTIAGVTIP